VASTGTAKLSVFTENDVIAMRKKARMPFAAPSPKEPRRAAGTPRHAPHLSRAARITRNRRGARERCAPHVFFLYMYVLRNSRGGGNGQGVRGGGNGNAVANHFGGH
jgi:hypothetical protein